MMMGALETDVEGARQPEDPQPERAAAEIDASEAPISPTVKIWLDLFADVIVEKVIREHRAKWEEAQKPVDAFGEEKQLPGRQPQRSGPVLDDQGQKVVKPKGRLLTIQEAADYLGMSRASLAGRGWRIKNRLPAIKIGRAVRFDLQMLDRWIERHREHLPRLPSESEEGDEKPRSS